DQAFTDRSYEFGELMFTGFYRRGLTSSLTAGVNLQFDDDSVLAGGDAIWANVMGNFLLNAGVSSSADLGEGFAADLDYRRTLDALEARFDLSLSYVSEDFAPVRQTLAAPTPIFLDDVPGILPPTDPVFGPLPPALGPGQVRNPVEWAVSASWRQRVGENWNLTTSASYDNLRTGAQDRWSVSTGASRRFGFGSLGVTARLESFDGDTEASAQISFTAPLGRRSGVSGSYDSERETARARFYRTGSGGVGSTSYSATASHAPSSSQLEARASYTGNRYRAELSQGVVSSDGRDTSGQTRARVAAGLMFADGRTAIGRPARNGFAIVSASDTFEDAELLVEPTITFSDEEQRFEARTDALGPAVLSDLIDYQPRSVQVVPENVPPGTTLDSTDVSVRPGLRSGYSIELGGEANVAVVATLVDSAGQPVQRVSGLARREGAPESEGAIFFTNETGRLYLDQLEPGQTYLLEIAGDDGRVARFTTPEDGFGLVRPDTPIRLSGGPI
ncbi:MAG: fimbria/pilus outer membrane usher protein, partial [Oceanicaulis sp.]